MELERKKIAWIALLGAVLMIIVRLLLIYVLPKIDKGDRMWCIYQFKIYSVEKPDFTQSRYYGLKPNHDKMGTGAHILYAPTIDDHIIQRIAWGLESQMKYCSDKKKASILMAFVQQNIDYFYDKDQYGRSDQWITPANAFARRRGDCEDSAFAFVALAYNCGLDVVCASVPGHMGAGVCIPDGMGASFYHNGKTYYWCEGTPWLPIIGFYPKLSLKDTKVEAFKPQFPTDHWVETLLPIE